MGMGIEMPSPRQPWNLAIVNAQKRLLDSVPRYYH